MAEFSKLNGYDVKDAEARDKLTKKLYYFNTVADMKLADLKDGDCVITLGYYTMDDNGGAIYKIRNAETGDVYDDTTLIQLNNLCVAELILQSKINPDNFPGATDNEKLQNAIDYVCKIYQAGQETVTVNLDRVYNITTTIKINKTNKRFPIVFEGNSKGGFYITNTNLLFTSDLDIVSDVIFNNITFRSVARNGLVIMNSPKFINVKFLNCTFKFIDCGVYSDTYIQAFQFDNCTIAGGAGNFIEFVGSYYLTVTNSIVEHRVDSWFIKQNYSTETSHNRQYFTNIDGNLIEGFTGSSGIIDITYYEVLNIINNYFESMPNTIRHNQHGYEGILNIKHNRLFQGTGIANLNQQGLLYLVPSQTNTYIMGNINFDGNSVDNTYCIYFNSTQINANENFRNYKINYGQNYVRNTFTSSFRYKNNQSSNTHFNILPVIKLESGTSKYDRYQFNFDGLMYWTETITANSTNYTVAFKLINGIFHINSQTQTEISTSKSTNSVYFGVDIHNDDIISCNIISNGCQILNYYRSGSANSKYLYLEKIKESGDPSNVIVNCNAICCGMKG